MTQFWFDHIRYIYRLHFVFENIEAMMAEKLFYEANDSLYIVQVGILERISLFALLKRVFSSLKLNITNNMFS